MVVMVAQVRLIDRVRAGVCRAMAATTLMFAACVAAPAVAADAVAADAVAVPPAVSAATPAPAAPHDTAASPPPVSELRVVATNDGAPDLDKVVCKTEVNSGSRLKSTKICMTQRQKAANGRQTAKRIDENTTPVSLTD